MKPLLKVITILNIFIVGCAYESERYVGGFPSMVVFRNGSEIDNDVYVNNLERCANNNDASAQYELGKLYYDGIGVIRSHQLAQQWWIKSSINGNIDAQYALGFLYLHGEGINLDFKEACRWLKQAADGNHQEAKLLYKKRCRY